jgi:hypothetical protein
MAMKRLATFLVAICLVTCCSGAVGATLINVDCNSHYGIQSTTDFNFTGAAMTGLPGDQWNYVSGSNTPISLTDVSLVDSTGASTAVKMDISAKFSYNFGRRSDTAAWDNLMTDAFVAGTTSNAHINVTLKNLRAGSYDLYLYSHSWLKPNTRGAIFTAGGRSITIGPCMGAKLYIEGQNWGVFRNLTVDGSGTLTFTGVPLNDIGYLEGFQLQSAAPGAGDYSELMGQPPELLNLNNLLCRWPAPALDITQVEKSVNFNWNRYCLVQFPATSAKYALAPGVKN